MLSEALPDTAGLGLVQACVALYRHGCTTAEVKAAMAGRCSKQTLASSMSQARLALGWRTPAPKPPLMRRPPDPVPPIQRLKPGERAALRETVTRMGPAQRARFRELAATHPAMEAAVLALRPERRAQPC